MGTNLTVGVLVGVAGLIGHLPDGRARLGPARPRRGGIGAGRAAGRPAHGRLSERQLVRAIGAALLVAGAAAPVQAAT